jgi:DNA-binding Xre family transcriptional regulator
VNGGKLNSILRDSGISITHLADKLGCTRNRVYNILNGEGSEVKVSEMRIICEVLHLSDEDKNDIFFAD